MAPVVKIEELRAQVLMYLTRIQRACRHLRSSPHVKLVDLGLHHDSRYLYTHDNQDPPHEELIGRIRRERDQVWEMLSHCVNTVRDGKQFRVVCAALRRGEFDPEP